MSAREVLRSFAAQQGWNEGSQVEVLCDFIDDLGETLGTDQLEVFLRSRANSENEEAENWF